MRNWRCWRNNSKSRQGEKTSADMIRSSIGGWSGKAIEEGGNPIPQSSSTGSMAAMLETHPNCGQGSGVVCAGLGQQGCSQPGIVGGIAEQAREAVKKAKISKTTGVDLRCCITLRAAFAIAGVPARLLPKPKDQN